MPQIIKKLATEAIWNELEFECAFYLPSCAYFAIALYAVGKQLYRITFFKLQEMSIWNHPITLLLQKRISAPI